MGWWSDGWKVQEEEKGNESSKNGKQPCPQKSLLAQKLNKNLTLNLLFTNNWASSNFVQTWENQSTKQIWCPSKIYQTWSNFNFTKILSSISNSLPLQKKNQISRKITLQKSASFKNLPSTKFGLPQNPAFHKIRPSTKFGPTQNSALHKIRP